MHEEVPPQLIFTWLKILQKGTHIGIHCKITALKLVASLKKSLDVQFYFEMYEYK